jgi:hypothetical protein
MVLLYMVCHGSHQYTPFMLAFFYQHQPDPSWDPKPRPSVEAPFCELQSHGAPVQLRPAAGAAAGILTLSSGELRITGCLGGNRVGVV